jgi:Na+/melibiose symporter-like transporter
MAVGAAITAPLTIFSRWLPSFAKQRVDFSVKVSAEGEELGDNGGAAGDEIETEKGAAGKKLTLRESFAIVKHNRWFMMWLVIDFIRLLAPGTDRMLIYRFLVPSKRVFGKDIDGLLIKTLFRDITFGWPALVFLPLAQKAVEWFGDPVKFIRAHIIINGVTQAITFATGYKSWPRLIVLWALEGVREVMGKWSAVPHSMIRYEMFDYVEWKTGVRSEGITQSVDGLLKKLLKDNIGSVIGNLVTQWTGYKGWDIPVAEQPERFLKTIWPLTHLRPIVGGVIALLAVLWFKYPHDPEEVEADLVERRALAEKMRAQVQEAPVGS